MQVSHFFTRSAGLGGGAYVGANWVFDISPDNTGAHGTWGNGDSAQQFDSWAIVKTLAGDVNIPPGKLTCFAKFGTSENDPGFRVGTSMKDYPVNWELYSGSSLDEVRTYDPRSGKGVWDSSKKIASVWYYTYNEPYVSPGGDGY